jgi:hypothetical protein
MSLREFFVSLLSPHHNIDSIDVHDLVRDLKLYIYENRIHLPDNYEEKTGRVMEAIAGLPLYYADGRVWLNNRPPSHIPRMSARSLNSSRSLGASLGGYASSPLASAMGGMHLSSHRGSGYPPRSLRYPDPDDLYN